MTKTYIGIDPGVNGAMAAVRVEEKTMQLINVIDLRNQAQIEKGLQGRWRTTNKVWVEETSGWNPKTRPNIASIRKLSVSIGFWHGFATACQLNSELVAARSWQKYFGKERCPGPTPKERVRWYLEKIYPEWAKMCRGPRGAWNYNRSDAIGIALACMWSAT